MKKKYFGTDGIRGESNKFPMTPDIILKVGMALGLKFKNGDYRHRVVIGKDTRISGYAIENALTSGFASVGMDVFLVGPVTTPAVSMLTKSMRADIGVMISASHNLYHDNGIKVFDQDGCKLSDDVESEIEMLIDSDLTEKLVLPHEIGRVKRIDDAKGRYIEFVKGSFPKDKTLNGIKIVVDCAHGASYAIAPTILRELGADVIEIGVDPNGLNINFECGSTDTRLLRKIVIDEKADIGIAFDGDADRLAVVDENGNNIDGDILIGMIALELFSSGRLKENKVVATILSNHGLEEFFKSKGISLIRANVGDRYVLDEMIKHNANFGGEKSGHIILKDYSTVGDGIIAGLVVLSILVDLKRKSSTNKISYATSLFNLLPQAIRNIKHQKKLSSDFLSSKSSELIDKKKKELEGGGRIILRKSGTENVVRLMIEGKEKSQIESIADEISLEILNDIN